MVFTRTITEASGGSAASPNLNRMPVSGGLIYQFELYLPPGSSGLLKVAVKDGADPLYPSELGEWFFGDNTLISFHDMYLMSSEPFLLNIWSYNEDTAYDHIFQVRIGMVSDPRLMAAYVPALTGEDLGTKIEELIANQASTREALRQRILDTIEEIETESE